MLHPIVTQSGPTQHSERAYLSGITSYPELYGAQERTLTSKSSTGHHFGQIAPVTALRAMPGAPKKTPGLGRPGEGHAGTTLLYASHQLSPVGRTTGDRFTARAFAVKQREADITPREIWSRLPSAPVGNFTTCPPLACCPVGTAVP